MASNPTSPNPINLAGYLPVLSKHNLRVTQLQPMVQKIFQEAVALVPNMRFNPFVFSCSNASSRRPQNHAYVSLDAMLGFMTHLLAVSAVSDTETEDNEDAPKYHLIQTNQSYSDLITHVLGYFSLDLVRQLFLNMRFDGQPIWFNCCLVPRKHFKRSVALTRTKITTSAQPSKSQGYQFLWCPDWNKHILAIQEIHETLQNHVLDNGYELMFPAEYWKEILLADNQLDLTRKAENALFPEFRDNDRQQLMKTIHNTFFENASTCRFGVRMNADQLAEIGPFLIRSSLPQMVTNPRFFGPFAVDVIEAKDFRASKDRSIEDRLAQLPDDFRKAIELCLQSCDYLQEVIKQEKHDSNYTLPMPETQRHALTVVSQMIQDLYNPDSPKHH
jgi:hypothetical protein